MINDKFPSFLEFSCQSNHFCLEDLEAVFCLPLSLLDIMNIILISMKKILKTYL